MIFVSDPDGRRIHAGEEWTVLTGQEVRASLGRGWLDRVHPADRGIVDDTYRQAIVETSEFSIRYRVLDATGRPRWVLAGGIPSFSPSDGAFIGFVGSLTEIADTERNFGGAHGSVGRFTPPPVHPSTAPGCTLDQTADHLIMAHALIEGDGGKNALPSLRRAMFEIGRALAARTGTRQTEAEAVAETAGDASSRIAVAASGAGPGPHPRASPPACGPPDAGSQLSRIASFERDRFIFRFEPARRADR